MIDLCNDIFQMECLHNYIMFQMLLTSINSYNFNDLQGCHYDCCVDVYI